MSFSDTLGGYLREGRNESHLNFQQDFGSDLARFLSDAREAGHNITINSGYRSPEHQARLYEEALTKYGSEQAARQWVAPPGRSRHNHGEAADLAYATDEARAWAHENARNYGMHFRMSHEPWHIEPMSTSNGQQAVALAEVRQENPVDINPVEVSEETNEESRASLNGERSEIADENERRSVAASGEASPANETDEPTTEDKPVPMDTSVTNALNNQQTRKLDDAARDFFRGLSPQQRMVEQAQFNLAKRNGESANLEDWFVENRFNSYFKAYMMGDQNSVMAMTPLQKSVMQNVQSMFNQSSSYAQSVMGLA